MQHMKKTPACSKCGKRYLLNHPTPDNVPVMVGFELEDGTVLNYCYRCIVEQTDIYNQISENINNDSLMEGDNG